MKRMRIRMMCGHWAVIDGDRPYREVAPRVRAIESSKCAACRANIVEPRMPRLWAADAAERERAERVRSLTWRRAAVLFKAAPADERGRFRRLFERVGRQTDASWWVAHERDALTVLAAEVGGERLD